jgi:hypothetical protein
VIFNITNVQLKFKTMKTKHFFMVILLFASISISAQGFFTSSPISVTGQYNLPDSGTPGIYQYVVRVLCNGVPSTQWYGPYPGYIGLQSISFTVTESLWVPDPLTKAYFKLQIYMSKNGGSGDGGDTYCDGQFEVLPSSLTGQTIIPLSVK